MREKRKREKKLLTSRVYLECANLLASVTFWKIPLNVVILSTFLYDIYFLTSMNEKINRNGVKINISNVVLKFLFLWFARSFVRSFASFVAFVFALVLTMIYYEIFVWKWNNLPPHWGSSACCLGLMMMMMVLLLLLLLLLHINCNSMFTV